MTAYAVVHDDPPEVYVAEDVDTLQWVLALRVVAQTPPDAFPADDLPRIRQALLDEQWGRAVELWIEHVGVAVDVYPDGTVVRAAEISAEMAAAELQFLPLFRS